jgi:hypothetical protein
MFRWVWYHISIAVQFNTLKVHRPPQTHLWMGFTFHLEFGLVYDKRREHRQLRLVRLRLLLAAKPVFEHLPHGRLVQVVNYTTATLTSAPRLSILHSLFYFQEAGNELATQRYIFPNPSTPRKVEWLAHCPIVRWTDNPTEARRFWIPQAPT